MSSKAISTALQAHYESGCTTLARLWKITRWVGDEPVSVGFTDHDKAIDYDGQSYAATSAFSASAIATASALAVDTVDLTGLLHDDGISAEDADAGLWDGAEFELLEVNWRDLTMGDNVLRCGTLGEVQRQGGQYKVELRGLLYLMQNTVGDVVTPSCTATLGDERCKVDLTAWRRTVTVIVVASNRYFATTLAEAPDWATFGRVTWQTGANAGRSMEVKRHLSGGELELQLPMARDVQIGDTLVVEAGCNKVHQVEVGVGTITIDTGAGTVGVPIDDGGITVTGDCKAKFDNVINFRGSPFSPTNKEVTVFGGQ